MVFTFKKLDRALVDADAGGLGYASYQMCENLSAINERRPRKGVIFFDGDDPWRTGCVRKMMAPLWLPLSSEARQVKLRVFGDVYYDSMDFWGAVTTGPGSSGPESSMVTLASGTDGLSNEITIDVTPWQPTGRRLCEVQLRMRSRLPSSPTTQTVSLFTPGLNSYQNGGYTSISGSYSGTFDPYDILGVTYKISTKVLDGYGVDSHWTVRANQNTATGNDAYVVYPYVDHNIFATHADLTRYSRIDIRAIYWEEVIDAPYIASARPKFPWEDGDRKYVSICSGRQGNAARIGELYDAGVHLAARRTPVWGVRPYVLGQPSNTYGWLASLDYAHTPHQTIQTASSDHWEVVGQIPLGKHQAFSGSGGISNRTAVEVFGVLHVLSERHEPGEIIQTKMRLRSLDPVTRSQSAASDTFDVQLRVVENNSYTGLTLGSHDDSYLYSTTAPQLGVGHFFSRMTNQGLWPLGEAGRTGASFTYGLLNDANGLEGQILALEIKGPDGEDDTNANGYTIVTSGMIALGAEGVEWSRVGT